MPKLVQVASAAIFGRGEHERQCLYSLRLPDARGPNEWEFPGGKVKAREEPHEAVIREGREELGVELAIVGDLAVRSLDLVTHVLVIYGFATRIVEGNPRPLASQRLEWMDPQHVVDRLSCSPGVYLLHRSVSDWLRRIA